MSLAETSFDGTTKTCTKAKRMDDAGLTKLRDHLRNFAAAREWERFHSPKNLAVALSVEAGELLEHFQWISDEESSAIAPNTIERIEEEVADVLLYLIRLADVLNIDLVEAAEHKLAVNETRYPVEKSRGTSKKYTEL